MSYTPGFNFYIPDVDDKNTEYVPGFQRNFEILDKILTSLVNQSIVDKYATNPLQIDRKRVVTDRIISPYEGHKDAITFLTEKSKHDTAGETYLKEAIENPHGITPDQLFSRNDLDRGKSSAYELLTPSGTYNPKLNQGHNAIIDEINNNNSDDPNQVQFPTDRSKKIRGYGRTNGNIEPIIDYSKMYIQDIGNNKENLTDSYQPYINEQERIDAKKYRNHKYLFVDTDNQLIDEYTNNTDSEINSRRDRHISLKDVNHFESHIRNKGQYTANEIRNKYPDMLSSQNEVSSIIKNPHNVTASELCDSYSNNNTENVGSRAIVRELNTLARHSDIEYKDQNDKIFWELIDKTSITSNENDLPKKPSIADILDHEHNSLSGIHGVNLQDLDEFQDKHISNKQGKKWEDHVNTELQNPHKLKAEQLFKKDNTYEGTKEKPQSTVAIIEQINIDIDKGLLKDSGITQENLYNNKKILWNAIDKENIDGIGSKANIEDIPLRLHDSLQEIHKLNLNNKEYNKNKHVSNMQLNSLFRYINIKDDSNIHHVSPKSLIGLPKEDKEPQKNNVNLIYTIDNNMTYVQLPMLDNLSKTQDLYIEVVFTEEIISKNSNIDLYVNDYYLGQVNSLQNRKFIIPLDYVENSNKFIMYWNDEAPTEESSKILTQLQYYQQEKFTGRDAIIDEINRKNTEQEKDYFKKILWERIEKDTSSLNELTTRPHRMLQDVLGYEILDDPNDELDNNETRNKHISCKDGERWDNHVATTDGSNPHKLKIENIKGITEGREGSLAIFDELNKYSLANHENKGLDKVGDNQISWHAISKKEMSFEDFPEEGKDHQKLTNILPITFMEDINVVSEEDRKADKHITNQQATKFNHHVDTISEITGVEDTNNLVNPHKLSAASLLSHKQSLNTLATQYTGGNAIVDAVNDYANDYSLSWKKINKAESSISDILSKDHSLLDNIRKPNTDTNIQEDIFDLHISQNNYNNWENHRLNLENPHKVKVEQLHDEEEKYTGIKAIVNTLNTSQDPNKILINHTNIKFGKDEINEIDDFNITTIPLRDHDDMQNVVVISGDEYKETIGHVQTSQIKAFNEHLANTENPHKVVASQVELGLTEEEKKTHYLESETLKNALFEIDEFRNRTTVGLANIMFEPPEVNGMVDPSYYFDKDKTAIYVPVCEVYLNNQPGFRGKIKKYTTPTVSINEDLPEEIEAKFGRNCYKILINGDNPKVPKDEAFVIIAYLEDGTAKIRVSQTSVMTQVTNGQSVNLMTGFISYGEDGNIKEAYCLPVGTTALGLPEQLFNRMLFLNPTARQTGMSLAHDERDLNPDNTNPELKKTDLSFIITEGSLWNGLKLQPFEEFKSKDNIETSPRLFLCIRTNEVIDSEGIKHEAKWIYDGKWKTVPNKICQNPKGGTMDVPESTIEDLKEDNPVKNIVTTFIYYVPAYRRFYMIMSEKLLAKPEELDIIGNRIFPQALPDLIKSAGILVGLMLCKNGPISIESDGHGSYKVVKDGNQIPARIYSPFDLIFTNTTTDVSATIDHNQLSGKYGNSPYYHLGYDEYNDLNFIFDKNVDDNGETSFDKKITKLAVDHRISEILKDSEVNESVNTITKIANNTYSNTINKLGKTGDSATGEYIFGTTEHTKNVLSIDANNNEASMFIGNQEVGEKSKGFFLGYKDSTLTLLSQNDKITSEAYDEKNLKIFDITSDGLFTVYTEFALPDLNINSSLLINNGLLSTDNISIPNTNNKYGMLLGNNTNQGTILFKHNKEYGSTVMRAKNEKFEIDTFGGLFINTDRSREEKNTQTNPVDPKNLKYINDLGNAIYDIYIGNIGSQETPKYPIILSNSNKSIFINGIHIGENFDSSDKLSINGNITLNNNNINGINNLYLQQYQISTNLSDNIGKILFNTNQQNGNFTLGLNNVDIFSCTFSKTKIDFVANNKVSLSLTNSVELYYNNNIKLTTIEDGIRISGNIYSNENKVVLENRRINVSGGLTGGGTLNQDITIGLSTASNTQIGGVKVDNKTIISNNGTITAKALQDTKFTMEYDSTIQGIVIKFN